MPLAKGVVHCLARKLDEVCDAHEAEHGRNTFVGSAAWLATQHPSWVDGTCLLAADHVGPHLYTDDKVAGRKERKAS